jgi:tryptophan synthase beta chain
VGPEHVQLAELERVEYTSVSDAEAVEAFHLLAETEGILPALESAHAVAEAARLAPRLRQRMVVLVNLSGRGDKDVESVLEWDAAHRHRHLEDADVMTHPAVRKWRGLTSALPDEEEDGEP